MPAGLYGPPSARRPSRGRRRRRRPAPLAPAAVGSRAAAPTSRPPRRPAAPRRVARRPARRPRPARRRRAAEQRLVAAGLSAAWPPPSSARPSSTACPSPRRGDLKTLVRAALARRFPSSPPRPGRRVARLRGRRRLRQDRARRAARHRLRRRRPRVVVVALRSRDGGAPLAAELEPLGVSVIAAADADQAAPPPAPPRAADHARRHARRSAPATPRPPRSPPSCARSAPPRSTSRCPPRSAPPRPTSWPARSRPLGLTHLALTHADQTARPGAPVELAIRTRRPLSYVAARDGVEPADAADARRRPSCRDARSAPSTSSVRLPDLGALPARSRPTTPGASSLALAVRGPPGSTRELDRPAVRRVPTARGVQRITGLADPDAAPPDVLRVRARRPRTSSSAATGSRVEAVVPIRVDLDRRRPPSAPTTTTVNLSGGGLLRPRPARRSPLGPRAASRSCSTPTPRPIPVVGRVVREAAADLKGVRFEHVARRPDAPHPLRHRARARRPADRAGRHERRAKQKRTSGEIAGAGRSSRRRRRPSPCHRRHPPPRAAAPASSRFAVSSLLSLRAGVPAFAALARGADRRRRRPSSPGARRAVWRPLCSPSSQARHAHEARRERRAAAEERAAATPRAAR